MQPLVSVLVLNYRNPAQTLLCVKNLLAQSIVESIEIIVIDNHSRDDSIGVLRNQLYPLSLALPPRGREYIRIIETPRNLGFGAGYNYGARYTNGHYLLINNPAKILEQTAIEKMIHRMQDDPSIGILAPKILHRDSTYRLSTRAFPSPWDVILKRTIFKKIFKARMRRYLQADANPNQERNTDWVIGGCFMIRSEDFYRLHGFDERFFLFFEDIDLCRRIHQINKRVVYDPSAIASDKKERLSGEGFWGLFLSGYGRTHILSAIKYFRKWGTAS